MSRRPSVAVALVGGVGAARAADQVVLAVAAADRVAPALPKAKSSFASALDVVAATLAVEAVVSVLTADRVVAARPGGRRAGRRRDVPELDRAG